MPLILDIPVFAQVGGFNPIDMLVVLVSFAVLLVLVRKFAWGPIMDMMKKREDYVANELQSAEESRQSAEALAKEAEDRLKEMKQEAQQMMEDARTLAATQEQSLLATAREEASRLKESARQDIAKEKEQALAAVKEQVASLSVLIATKVIEKELSEQDQTALIDEFVGQLGEGS